MNKKVLLIIMSFLLVIGCSKKEEEVKPEEKIINETFSCKIEKKTSPKITSMDDQFVVEISNSVLKKYKTITNYDYSGMNVYEEICAYYKNEETNNKYDSIKNKVTCNDEKKTILVEKEYDIEEAMKNSETKEMINDLIDYIKDNKFDFNSWKKDREEEGFICN